MYIVIFTSFVAILLTYLESRNKIVGGMKWGFIFLTLLGCIHYDYGNDYLGYLDIYNNITKYPFDLELVLSGELFKEPGWAILCYLFKHFGGFFMMVAVLSVIQNILLYKIIKEYVEKRWWPLSVLVYVCFSELYLLGFSMMRQSFVIFVFLGIWPLIEKRKCILASVILFLCSTIHSSALVLLPFAFFGYLPVRRSKLWAWSFIIFYLAIWFGGTFINTVFSSFMYIEQFSDYAETYGDSSERVTFGIGFLLNQIPFILSLLYLLDDNNKTQIDKKLVVLSIISFVIIPFSTIVPLVGRIGMYFVAFQVVAIPKVYASINNVSLRYIAFFILIFMTLYSYFAFFNNPLWAPKYTIFKTIFPHVF